MKNSAIMAAAALALLAPASSAMAGTVNATLSAFYFQVASGSDPDFDIYSTPTVADGSGLTNGFPTATGGVNDIVGGELTWWDPSKNPNVTATGTGTISLPYSSNMYAPSSTGSNDASFFETAYFTGVFTLASAGTVEFLLGSDDDSFIYVDGLLVEQNPGVHGVTNVDITTPELGAGGHSLEIFYADRHQVGAELSLDLVSTDVVITPGGPAAPEASTWVMMGLGFAGLGFAGYRSRRTPAHIA